MIYNIIKSIVIYTSLLVMLCGITIATVGIIKNIVFINRYNKDLVKIKITKFDSEFDSELFFLALFCVCVLFLSLIYFNFSISNSSESGLKEALSVIHFYYLYTGTLGVASILLIIINFIPTIFTKNYIIIKCIKRYKNSQITYQFKEKNMIFYHNDMIVLTIRMGKKHEKSIEILKEWYRIKEQGTEKEIG